MAYYVYRHIRLDTNTPFYVGKGTEKRSRDRWARSLYWKRITRKAGYKVQIMASGLTEDQALEMEKNFIQLYKRLGYCEANLVEGGRGGSSGVIHSTERNNKISRAAKERLKTSHHNSKEIVCIETGVVYKDAVQAAAKLGLNQGHINKVCNGNRKSHGGFTFKFTKVG